VPKFIVPIAVVGPVNFTLFAVWSKSKQRHPYIEGVVKAVEMYSDLLNAPPSVLMGDLNSNAIWDHTHSVDMNHSALVKMLASFGLVSAYHSFFAEEHGRESRHTYHFHWKEDHPFHIDYCFIPSAWTQHLQNVDIRGFHEWTPTATIG